MEKHNIKVYDDSEEQLPLVSICSITYNHAPYIRQCLDSFLMQKTNFRYEIIIHDDASTDGTAEIIKEYAEKYPDLITPIFQIENQYSKGVRGMFARFVFPKANGKYIAMCEGDDYWTDPFKLQKQVDFLEANPEYVMCFTNAIQHFQDDKSKEDSIFSCVKDVDYAGVDIYYNWIVPTASVMLKTDITRTPTYLKSVANDKFIFGDIILFLSCAHYGKIRGLNFVSCVYRRANSGAVATQRSTFKGQRSYCNHTLEIYRFFGEQYKKCCEQIYHATCITIFRKGVSGETSKTEQWQFLLDSWKYSIFGTIRAIFKSYMHDFRLFIHGKRK